MQVVANFPGNQKTLGDDLKFGIYVVKKKNAGCVSIGKNFSQNTGCVGNNFYQLCLRF